MEILVIEFVLAKHFCVITFDLVIISRPDPFGLHTEMALWSTLGDILEESGWTTALVEAEIASSGTADSFLKVSHLTRTRHAHQLTLLTLHKLQQEAFAKFEGNSSADDWRKEMVKRSPTFMFWDLVMRYETPRFC